MPIRSSAVLLLWLFAQGAPAGSEADLRSQERTVVVMVFDGWASTMVEDYETPSLDRIRHEGAWARAFIPAFPSTSYVNGVTISTGCWPERHGIVGNRFLDPERGLYDHSSDPDWLSDCEHLHEAAERQGVRTAALGWYGRISPTRGPRASIVTEEPDPRSFPGDAERAEEVIAQLAKPPETRPRLILAYFRGPDETAHFKGLDSRKTRRAVQRSDAAIGRVLDAIDRLPDRNRVTLLVTTDHGMRPVSHLVNITRILRSHALEGAAVSDGGSVSFLYFEDPAEVDRAMAELSSYEQFDVFRREEQPGWSHLGTGERVGEVILSAHPPYFVADSDLWPWRYRWLARIGPKFLWARFRFKASHGYPPDTPGMAGILYARGAGISRGEIPSMRAVDVHPTVTALVGIAPGRPVDGRVEARLLSFEPSTMGAR
jgi:alkaline phosphatase D